MSDKHLFRKKKNDAVEPETIAPDVETQDMENTDGQETQEFVYGMDLQEDEGTDSGKAVEADPEAGTDKEAGGERLGSEENIIECDSLVKIYKTDDVEDGEIVER